MGGSGGKPNTENTLIPSLTSPELSNVELGDNSAENNSLVGCKAVVKNSAENNTSLRNCFGERERHASFSLQS